MPQVREIGARTSFADVTNVLALPFNTPFNPSADFPLLTPPFSVVSMRVVSAQPAVTASTITALGGDQYRFDGTMLLAFEVEGTAQTGQLFLSYIEVQTPFSVVLRSTADATDQFIALLTNGTVPDVSLVSGTLSFTYTGTLKAVVVDATTRSWPILLNAPQGACGRNDQQQPTTTAPFACTTLKPVALDAPINCETIGTPYFSGIAGVPPYSIVSVQPGQFAQGMFNVRHGGGGIYLYEAIVPLFLRLADSIGAEFDTYLPIRVSGSFVPLQPFSPAEFDLLFDLQLTALNFSAPDRLLVMIGRVLGLAWQAQAYPAVSFVQTLPPSMGTVSCAQVAP